MGKNLPIEKYVPAVRLNNGLLTYKNVIIGQSGVNPATTGGLTVNGLLTLNFGATFAGYSQSTALVLASSATVTVPSTNSVITHVPTQSETINFPAATVVGINIWFIVTTSGASSFTLTFGTNTKSQGTLTTGTSTGKVFVVAFISDGTNWDETGRTTAM